MNNHQRHKSDRLRLFQPKDFGQICKAFDFNVSEVARQIGVMPPTLQKVVTGDTKRPAISTVDDFTQYVMESYRIRKILPKPVIPERISIISPYHFQKEMDKRGIGVPELARKMNNISRATLNCYVKNKWGNTGPTYLFSVWISDAIYEYPVLSKTQLENHMAGMQIEYTDDYGDPKLSDEKKWSFYEAQQEWLERDQKKLAKLPKAGHLTQYQK